MDIEKKLSIVKKFLNTIKYPFIKLKLFFMINYWFYSISGGVSSHNGFLNSVWEFSVEKESWTKWLTRGNGPKGIYGHSTVFHQQTNSLYVFGGQIYDKQQFSISNNLYMLEYQTKTWTELNSLGSSHLVNWILSKTSNIALFLLISA